MRDVLKAVVYAGLFAVPLLTLYVETDYFFPFITGKNFWFRIIVDLVLVAWIILALYDVKYRPKISGIVWSFGSLLVIMFFANLLGQHPPSSFWSNFERMDGYVSLVHTFLYMFVLGNMLHSKEHWQRLLNTSLVVAFIVALYGLAQYGGDGSGSGRIDSRLGNAAYMAVYMLFHIFIAFWLFVETKNTMNKVFYGALAVIFTFVLIETGTRGAAIGLAVGVMVMSAYIGLFGNQFKEYRKYAIGGFVLLALVATAFIVGRDSALVQSNPNLARIANISLDDLRIRGIIWGMAFEGVKERPLLGYGQSNFNYVFNENYDPRLYAQEQWFDRAHNIFMDWLVAGGILGLVAYLSIFGWCLYYLLVRPLLKKEDNSFNVMERGVLLGILAGYFTHNFVVFDNIVSYIFFAIILALINSRVGIIPAKLSKLKFNQEIITQFAIPVAGAVFIAVVYFVHLPGMQAAGDVIKAFRTDDLKERLAHFETALSRESFAHQEITEQISQQAINIVRDQKVSVEVREKYSAVTERELRKLVERKPGDARVHVFVGSYYRATNQIEKAKEQMKLARDFSPKKQSIIIQQGSIALSEGDNAGASALFQEAFLLDTNNLEAREYLIASLLTVGRVEEAIALVNSEEVKSRISKSNFVISSAYQASEFEFIIDLYEHRLNGETSEKSEVEDWVKLAALYYETDNNVKAIETLSKAKEAIPSFARTADCFISNLEQGKDPQIGCQ